jgi:hypothetical protein
MPTRKRDDGMGSPSKYFDFPEAFFGMRATVALNLASRARPQQTKPVRKTVSNHVRSPIAKANKPGATPKDILRDGLVNGR